MRGARSGARGCEGILCQRLVGNQQRTRLGTSRLEARLLIPSFHRNCSAAHGQTLLAPSDSTVHLSFNTLQLRKGKGVSSFDRDNWRKQKFRLSKICLKILFNQVFSLYCTVLAASRYKSGIRKYGKFNVLDIQSHYEMIFLVDEICCLTPFSLFHFQVRNGHIKRITDNDIQSLVLEVVGTNVR